jgi:hypothetical protein
MIGFKDQLLFIKSTSADLLVESADNLNLKAISGDINIETASKYVVTAGTTSLVASSVENVVLNDSLAFKAIAANVELGKDVNSSIHINGNTRVTGDLYVEGEINLSSNTRINHTAFNAKADKIDLPNFFGDESTVKLIIAPGSTELVHDLQVNLDPTRGYVAAFNAQYSTQPEAVTIKAKEDLKSFYDHLLTLPITKKLSTPLDNITLIAGVYSIEGACVAGNLTLSGSENDVFVFRIAGAFTTNTSTMVLLNGGVNPTNIFWLTTAGAAIALAHVGENNSFPGRLIAAAAISMGAGGIIDGGMFSMAGAVSFNTSTIRKPETISVLNDKMGSVVPFAVFTILGAVANTGATTFVIGDIGTNGGAISGFPPSAENNFYNVTDNLTQYYIYFTADNHVFSKRYVNNVVGCIKGGIISLHTIIPPGHSNVIVTIQSIRGGITFEERAFSLIGLSLVQ